MRHVRVITHQGHVLGTVPWGSERHWSIERLCRDTGLAPQVVDEVDAPMLSRTATGWPYRWRRRPPFAGRDSPTTRRR